MRRTKTVRVRLWGGAVVSAVKRKIFWLSYQNCFPVSRRNEQWPQRHASWGPPRHLMFFSLTLALFLINVVVVECRGCGGRSVRAGARSRQKPALGAAGAGRRARSVASPRRHAMAYGMAQCSTPHVSTLRAALCTESSTVLYSILQYSPRDGISLPAAAAAAAASG